jgi:hypothetical protein
MAQQERSQPQFEVYPSSFIDQQYVANPAKDKGENGENQRIFRRDNIKRKEERNNKDFAYPPGPFFLERNKNNVGGAYDNKNPQGNSHENHILIIKQPA